MDINHISVSRSQVWNTCKQQYKFKYHLKTKVDLPEMPYFLYGKMVHKIIEVYTKAKGQVNIETIKHDCLMGNIQLEPDKNIVPKHKLPKEYVNKLHYHIDMFLRLTNKIGTDGLVEVPFNLDLEDPNKKLVNGFLDRLIIKDNKATIIDYKTTKQGRWRKTQKDISNDLQLRCYSLVVWKQYGIKPENITAALYYLDGGNLIGSSFTEKSLTEAHSVLLNIYNDIDKSNPDTVLGRTGDHCERCDYRYICPLLQLIK